MTTSGHAVVGLAVERSSELRLLHAAPLLEKEGDFGAAALIAEADDPVAVQGASAVAAFAADDDPVDVGEVEGAEVFEEGFDGEEGGMGASGAEVIDAGEAKLAIFDADAPPDVLALGGELDRKSVV